MLIKKYKATRMIADRIRPPVKSKKLELEHLCLIDEALDADNEISNIHMYSHTGMFCV